MRKELYTYKILQRIRVDLQERFRELRTLARDSSEQAYRQVEINFAIFCVEDEMSKLREKL